MKICSVEGCERKLLCRGWCDMHYQRVRKYGEPGPVGPLSGHVIPVEERFWRSISLDEESGCWNWTGSTKGQQGYATFRVNARKTKVHRFAYELLVGPIPAGLHIDHLCRNPSCVNPGHLEPVTQRENSLRGESFQAQNARKTHCKRGHPLTGPEADLVPDVRLGRRICRKCAHIHRRTRYLRHGK